MMGVCFKLFGQSIEDGKITKSTGSAFYVAEHYLLTCKHLVSALKPGDQLSFCYGSSNYSAVLVEIAEGWDLALLYTETPAQEEWIYSLDRVALAGRKAIAYGYRHGLELVNQPGLEIGIELASGVPLTNANGVTRGFSGGPLCPVSDLSSVIGVITTITVVDEYGRGAEGAGFVSVCVALELWGDRYGLLEKRYMDVPDAFGVNDFVYSAKKTIFQDPHDYLGKLRAFIEDKRPVLWWAVVAPGGSGKSRLSYELATSLNSNWRCKLLQVGALEKKNLQALYEAAGRSFLLIADYAYSDTNELGEWLEECARTQNGPHIRVLLLQRETGNNNIGWQESLLRCRRNLINLRYQEDLQLETMEPEYTISIMRSYAENMGGGKIDAPALYTVLENVDPGLTRPLFAMFIADAALKGDGPLEWDPEKALKYFIRRVQNEVERALSKEDAKAVMLLLIIATIANGFTFDVDLLDSKPLCDLEVLIDLSEKSYFGKRLNNARLADRDHGRYTIKPMKPDLLGEYYVLYSFREMMSDQQKKESVSALLEVSKKTDSIAASGFLARLFADYETDEELVSLFCGGDGLFRVSVSYGLILRKDTILLRKLYKKYGTEFWLEPFVYGLVYSFNYHTEPDKAEALLKEIHELYMELSGNDEDTRTLVESSVSAIAHVLTPDKAGVLLKELRELREERRWNAKVVAEFAGDLYNNIGDLGVQSETDRMLLNELLELHKDQPGNDEFTELFAKGLLDAILHQNETEKANALLDELRELHDEQPRNAMVTGVLAKGLFNTFVIQIETAKAGMLLDELRELHDEQPRNAMVTEVLAKGLCRAIYESSDSMNIKALLDELRKLHSEEPRNDEVTGAIARGLLYTFQKQTDPKIARELFHELHKIFSEEPRNREVIRAYLRANADAFNKYMNDPKIAVKLLD